MYLNDVLRAIRNTVRISKSRKAPQLVVDIPETKQPICVYISERNLLALYSVQNGLDKKTKIRDDGLKLPDVVTPILHEGWAYLLDGCVYSQDRRVFVPNSQPIRVNVDTGVAQPLPSSKFGRIKCGIVSNKTHAYLLGGMVTEQKIRTSTCERFRFSDFTWEKIGSLRRPHTCASACFFNGSIFLFSKLGIEKLNLQTLEWNEVTVPFGMMLPSYSFAVQISATEIALLGGWSQTSRLQSVELYNTETETSSCLQNILPTAICQERVSGVCISTNKLFLISPFHGEVNPQVALKKGVYQVIVSWSNISQVKELITI